MGGGGVLCRGKNFQVSFIIILVQLRMGIELMFIFKHSHIFFTLKWSARMYINYHIAKLYSRIALIRTIKHIF